MAQPSHPVAYRLQTVSPLSSAPRLPRQGLPLFPLLSQSSTLSLPQPPLPWGVNRLALPDILPTCRWLSTPGQFPLLNTNHSGHFLLYYFANTLHNTNQRDNRCSSYLLLPSLKLCAPGADGWLLYLVTVSSGWTDEGVGGLKAWTEVQCGLPCLLPAVPELAFRRWVPRQRPLPAKNLI